MPVLHGAAQAEITRLRALSAKGVDARLCLFSKLTPTLFDLYIKDNRITDPARNQALDTDSLPVAKWNRYEIGTAALHPDSTVTFV